MQHVSDAPMIGKIIGIGPIMPSIHPHRLKLIPTDLVLVGITGLSYVVVWVVKVAY